MPFIRNT
jgi:hypothetical protein